MSKHTAKTKSNKPKTLLGDPLSDDMKRYFEQRGCKTPPERRGIFALTADANHKEFGWLCPSACMPYSNMDGTPLMDGDSRYIRARNFSASAKVNKFAQKEGTTSHAYYDPAGPDFKAVLNGDPTTIILAEVNHIDEANTHRIRWSYSRSETALGFGAYRDMFTEGALIFGTW